VQTFPAPPDTTTGSASVTTTSGETSSPGDTKSTSGESSDRRTSFFPPLLPDDTVLQAGRLTLLDSVGDIELGDSRRNRGQRTATNGSPYGT
jgi:hypothetical protein